jgi:3-hydroxyacyl-CoA dehydrogenase/enoyl-CoA hydratase/3-hydroxybutyryl-CoA epimerase
VKRIKKIPVIVKGTPGFLVNRLLMPYLNEAGKLVDEGVSVTAIDRAMTGFGWPMGPLRLVDEIGVDVACDVARELAAAFGERMAVCAVLEKLHHQGLKGRKGGRGFYVYRKGRHAGDAPKPNRSLGRGESSLEPASIEHRLMKMMVEEARLCLDEQVVASEDDIDVAMIFGTGFPPFRGGLMPYARQSGLWSPDGHPELRLKDE